jgi:hypothetical protein
MGDGRGFWSGDPRERGHLEDLGLDGKIIPKWTFKERDWELWSGFLWLRIGTGFGFL